MSFSNSGTISRDDKYLGMVSRGEKLSRDAIPALNLGWPSRDFKTHVMHQGPAHLLQPEQRDAAACGRFRSPRGTSKDGIYRDLVEHLQKKILIVQFYSRRSTQSLLLNLVVDHVLVKSA